MVAILAMPIMILQPFVQSMQITYSEYWTIRIAIGMQLELKERDVPRMESDRLYCDLPKTNVNILSLSG